MPSAPQIPEPPDTACRALRWCRALLDGLAAGGLATLILSPGSRSTPVVLAASRHGSIEPIPILDERSAAFFALGAARASGRPVALLATSGSAPAHWYPAVIEAEASGVPLVLLSADRPPRLRGWGANQTIDQTRLFGVFVRERHDPGLPEDSPAGLKAARALGLRAAIRALEPDPGPIHINLPFDEPLVPEQDCPPSELPPLQRPPTPATRRLALIDCPTGRGLVVCGPGSGGADLLRALRELVRTSSLPVLADPLSGLRTGPGAACVLSRYDAILRNPEAAERLRPDWILRLGATPVSKRLLEWMNGVPTLLCAHGDTWSDPNHDLIGRISAPAADLLDALASLAAPQPDPKWLKFWRAAESAAERIAAGQLARSPWFEGQLIRTLLDQIPDGESLLCANSLPIRQLDTWSGTREKPLRIFASRGASGIDGQTSTLAGLNHGGGPCWGLLGDLSLVHDLSGLLLAERLRRPLLVVNNGGGRIFDYLPQRRLPEIETFWRTPVALDLRALAATFGLRHVPVSDHETLSRTLAGAPGARTLIEVQVDAEQSRAIHLDYWQRVADAALFDDPPSS